MSQVSPSKGTDPFVPGRAFDPMSAAIVVVTFNRSHLLEKLLSSVRLMDPKPGRVIVVDNASADNTSEVVEEQRTGLGTELIYHRMQENTGGAGGFSEGVRVAYESGAEWLWLMDDDVEVLPDALGRLGTWAPRFGSIQGRRYDYDGSAFYWQYRISPSLAIPIPWAPASFDSSGYRVMNSGCFEGMFIHRDIVQALGLPDPRFFIYWDDTVYGWMASQLTTAVVIDEFILRRTREIKQWDMGVRHLNASSDTYRYYILRNRGIMKHYFSAFDSYKPIRFAFGTALTFAKEIIRLLIVERKVRGTSNLFRGLRDGRKIARDRSYLVMRPLTAR